MIIWILQLVSISHVFQRWHDKETKKRLEHIQVGQNSDFTSRHYTLCFYRKVKHEILIYRSTAVLCVSSDTPLAQMLYFVRLLSWFVFFGLDHSNKHQAKAWRSIRSLGYTCTRIKVWILMHVCQCLSRRSVVCRWLDKKYAWCRIVCSSFHSVQTKPSVTPLPCHHYFLFKIPGKSRPSEKSSIWLSGKACRVGLFSIIAASNSTITRKRQTYQPQYGKPRRNSATVVM